MMVVDAAKGIIPNKKVLGFRYRCLRSFNANARGES